MKKVLLLAAFGVAGLMSASENRNDFSNSQKLFVDEEKYELNAVVVDHDWIVVETWCGKVFYLDNNHYESFEAIGADANYFTDQQCGPF